MHKMIFCYFFVRFCFCCYTFAPLQAREIVVLAYRNCATSVTRRDKVNKRSNRKKSISHCALAFMAFAKGQLYKTVTDFHCPLLSKRLSKFVVYCVVNHWKTRVFQFLKDRVLTHLWQGKLIYDGYLFI